MPAMVSRILLSTSFVLGSASVAAASLAGSGRSIDGDSLMVGEQEVRLYGIDAPELTQTCTRASSPWACGKAAADQLGQLIASQRVSCDVIGKDQHGRTLARCRAGGKDINRTMVAMGYALAYRRYSMDYVSAEDSAKLSKRGIWSGSFELPSEVRQAGEDYRIAAPSARPSRSRARPPVVSERSKLQLSGNCRIKGNHSRKGELIYHLPGMPYYAETRAEAMFCTEAQARAAGYRRSRADQHR